MANYKKIGIDMGHSLSGAGTGASKYLTEVTENRKIGKELIAMLKEKGYTVINCTVDSATSTDNQLVGIVNKANAQDLDMFISIHLNAGGGAGGTETYIYNGNYSGKKSNKSFAKTINDAIASSCGFNNRGVKEAGYYVLKQTKAPAVLVEVCFVDVQGDKTKLNTSKVAKAMFKAITGVDYKASNSSTTSNSSQLYRIRKTWADVSTQKGAFSNKDNAIAECKKHSGYKVFDNSGKQVYPTSSNCEASITDKAKSGRATITESSGIIFRDKHCTHCGVKQGTYEKGESVYYDRVCETDKYTWISWIGGNGARRWMPIYDKKSGERWAVCK